MERLAAFVGGVFLLSLLVTTGAVAQQGMKWRGSGEWGPNTAYGRMYDTKTVETIRGQVASVERFTPIQGMSAGVHLVVKTEKETISVHLGPEWYVERQDTRIEAKDAVEVKGSRVTIRGKPAVIAAEVRKGGQVLFLRDDTGFPAWSGWRRR